MSHGHDVVAAPPSPQAMALTDCEWPPHPPDDAGLGQRLQAAVTGLLGLAVHVAAAKQQGRAVGCQGVGDAPKEVHIPGGGGDGV